MDKKACFDLSTFRKILACEIIPAVYEKHLLECRRCATLFKALQKPQPEGLATEMNNIDHLISVGKNTDKTPSKGDLWRLKRQDAYGCHPFAVVISGERESGKELIDARLISFDAFENQITENDAVLTKKESPLNIRFLVDSWCQVRLLQDDFESYIGTFDKKVLAKIEKAILATASENNLPEMVIEYRNHRLALASQITRKSPARKPFLENLTDKIMDKFSKIMAEFEVAFQPAFAAVKSKEDAKFELWCKNVVSHIQGGNMSAMAAKVKDSLKIRLAKKEFEAKFEILAADGEVLADFLSEKGIIIVKSTAIKDWSKARKCRFMTKS